MIGDCVMLEAVYGCLQLVLFVGNDRQRNVIMCKSQKRKQKVLQGRNEAVDRVGVSLAVLQIPQCSLGSFIL